LGILQSAASYRCVGTTVVVVVVVVVILHAYILSIIVQSGRAHVPTRIGNAVIIITRSSIVDISIVVVVVVAIQRRRARIGTRGSR